MTDHIPWRCHSCSFPIEDGCGAIVAPYREITSPTAWITWTPQHYVCQPDDGYAIDVSQARSPGDLLDWTIHLSAKTWAPRSNWNTIIKTAMDRPREVGA